MPRDDIGDDIGDDTTPEGGQEMPAGLSHAGAVVDKAIEYMIGQKIDPMAIASALLGGSLGLLARTMGDEAIVRVLTNALASVRNGELREPGGRA